MSVRMSGAMPTGSTNGLASLAHAITEHPDTVRVAIILFDAIKLAHDVSSGDIVPTVRVRAIEPIWAHETDVAELRRLMRRAYERRTGQVELPLDMERELESLTLDPDPDHEDKGTDIDKDKPPW